MIKKIIPFFVIAILLYACGGSSTDGPGVPTDNFDRKEMLTHLADNIILPAFNSFNGKVSLLKTATENFTTTPTLVTLEAVKVAWLAAYKQWQHVEMFNIGKAEELQFVNHMNIYPVTAADIENNVTSGTYDLNHVNNHDAQGFPAIDYLLYGIGVDNNEVLAKFSTGGKADSYKKYLKDVVAKIEVVTTAIVNDWNGAYKNTFISNSGNTGTSSLNKIVNDYVQGYEKGIRTNKFGVPAGVFSGGTTFTEKVEAFYKKTVSKELALEALMASQNFFNGKNTGSSFKTYLIYLDRKDLATSINNQFDVARTQINTLKDNFAEQVTTDNVAMTKSYDELQKNIVLLKVDMMQAFNVSIDAGYQDNDGD